MSELLLDFRWLRPDGLTKLILDGASGDLVIRMSEPRHFARYEPLLEETGLFRTLADAEPTPEGVLALANRYGFLGMDVLLTPVREPFERVDHWVCAIGWLKYWVSMWDLARAADRRGLERRLRLLNHTGTRFMGMPFNTALLSGTPERRPACETFFSADQEAALLLPCQLEIDVMWFLARLGRDWQHRSRTEADEIKGYRVVKALTDPVEAALLYCAAEVNTQLRGALNYWLGPALRFHLSPASLWAGILYQFAAAMADAKKHQQCAGCGKWFELSPGVGRSDKVWCSDTCRVRAVRQRREQAVRLHREGKTLKEIVRATGAKAESVKGWISKAKKGG